MKPRAVGTTPLDVLTDADITALLAVGTGSTFDARRDTRARALLPLDGSTGKRVRRPHGRRPDVAAVEPRTSLVRAQRLTPMMS